MNPFRIGLMFLFSFLSVVTGHGQEDTLHITQEVEIVESPIRSNHLGSKTTTWNNSETSKLVAHNVADHLSRNGNVYIKNYGPGSIATSSIRGGSAGHTLTLWNGIPLTSPMLGLLDLSLIPTFSFENISLQKGGQSAAWGSGAIGGVIALGNHSNFQSGYRIMSSTRLGSFGHLAQKNAIRIGNENLQSVTKFSTESATNDFPYSVTNNAPDIKQTNGDFDSKNFFQDIYYKLDRNTKIALHYWQQSTERGIPPLTTQRTSNARQEDQSKRILANLTRTKTNHILKAKIAYFNESLVYSDPQIGLIANSQFNTIAGDLEMDYNITNSSSINVGLSHMNTTATTDGYSVSQHQNNTALYSNYRYVQNKWKAQLSIRQGLTDNSINPLIPSIGLEYHANPKLVLKSKISKNFRQPTLNDQYWEPGGNTFLKPEQGWSEELTLEYSSKNKTSGFAFSQTIFNRKIKNWILWSIRSGEVYFSANNVGQVWSRGYEQSVRYKFVYSNLQAQLYANYNYTLSTNEVATINPTIEKGSQLLYTPKHQGEIGTLITWQELNVRFSHQYISMAQGINEDLDSFVIGNASFHCNPSWQNLGIQFSLYINNIWNHTYRVVERRPMPGRNFALGVTLNLTKTKT